MQGATQSKPGKFFGAGYEAPYLAIILILAVVLRTWNLDRDLWFDELASLQFAHVSLGNLWSSWMVIETNPPLYYSLLKLWTGLFGESDSAIRSLSALLGSSCVLLTYALVRACAGRREGLLAALLIAVSAPALVYSEQARAFILAQAFALVAVIAAVKIIASAARQARLDRWHLLYVVACAGAVYSHTTMIVFPLLLNLFVLPYVLLSRKGTQGVVLWIAVNAGVALLWGWWGYITLQQGLHPGNVSWMTAPGLRDALHQWLSGQASWTFPRLALLAFCGLAIGAAAIRLRNGVGLLLPYLAAAIPLSFFLLSQITPIFAERTLHWGAPFLLGSIAAAILWLPWRWAQVALVGCWLVFACLDLRAALARGPDYTTVVERVRADDERAIVYTNTPFAVARYCAAPCGLEIYADDGSWLAEAFAFPQATPDDLRALAQAEGRSLFVVSRGEQWLGRFDGAPLAPVSAFDIASEPRVFVHRLAAAGARLQ